AEATKTVNTLSGVDYGRDSLCKIATLFGGFAASTEADHVVPISRGGARYDMSNGQGACKPCRARKTAIEDSYFTRWRSRGAQISRNGGPGYPLLRAQHTAAN